MASSTLSELLKQAEDAGVSSWVPADGQPYELEVINANAGRTKNGDPKFGIQLKVTEGPDTGKSFWTNYNLRAVKANGEPNSLGLALTFKDLAILGAPAETLSGWDVDAADINEKVKDALTGSRVSAKASVSGDFVNLKSLKASSGAPAPAAATTLADLTTPLSADTPVADRPF